MTEMVAQGGHQLTGLRRDMDAAVVRKDAATAGKIVDTLDGLVKAAVDLKLKTRVHNDIVEQHFWAAVDLGVLLNEICPHGGARPSKSTLARLDISDGLSSFARKCALVHPEDARTYFSETNSNKANISSMLKLNTEMTTDPPSDREKVVGKLAQMQKLAKDVQGAYAATDKERAACVMFEEALG